MPNAYEISNRDSGHSFGVYVAESADAAWRALCEEANAVGEPMGDDIVIVAVHTPLTAAEIAALEALFAARTGKTFEGRDALFLEVSSALEQTGSCEIPSHLTRSGQPEILSRADVA